jgi:hypothetical protein
MKSKLAYLLTLLSLITGCASAYKAPQEGDTAKIRYVNATTRDTINVFTFSDTQCSDATLIGALGKIKYRQEDGIATQGMPLIDNLDVNRVKEIIVPADKPFVSHVRRMDVGLMSTTFCRVTFLINPKKDGLYEVVYHETTTGCYVKLYTIDKDQTGAYRRVESPALADRNVKQCSY